MTSEATENPGAVGSPVDWPVGRPVLDAPQVEVLLSYGGGGNLGSLGISMSMDEYRGGIEGRERELFAERYGVPWDAIASWSASDGRIRCIATTRRGWRCRCWVAGVLHKDPASWAKADEAGGYCFTHLQA